MTKTRVRRLKLDVLKPHRPGVVEFAAGLGAYEGADSVDVKVLEMDEQTETLEIVVTGRDIDVRQVTKRITELSGSVHSIDEVLVEREVEGSAGDA